MSPQKVLQLRSSVGFYGAENVIIEIAKAISDSSYVPVIGVLANSHTSHAELAAVAQTYKMENKVFQCDGRFSRKTASAIRQFMLENDIGIIHTHGYKADFYATLTTLNTKIKRVATIHPWLGVDSQITAKLYANLDHLLLRSFHRIVAISAEMREQLLQKGLFDSNIVTIENGIDLQRFAVVTDNHDVRRQFNLPSGTRVIGTIGRLSAEKGHSILLRAAKSLIAEFSHLTFIIVGDGSLRQKLTDEIAALGLEQHFVFTGVCADIPKALSVMEIFVLPSRSEGLPMALLEAMGAQKAIVTSAVGSIPRIIKNRISGLTVPPDDHQALYEAIAFLLRHPQQAIKMAKQAFVDVQSFSAREMGKKYIQLYNELLDGHDRGATN